MALYLLVSADAVLTGGMDRANYALVSYLARRGDEVHLVSHQAAPELLEFPNVIFHSVCKPAGSYLLGEVLINRTGRRWARRIQSRGGRVIVNGGNCRWGDVNWVHYVHAVYKPQSALGPLRQLKAHLSHRMFLQHEHVALRRARVIIANSERTKRDLCKNFGIPQDRIRVIYYGTDPAQFLIVSPTERAVAKSDMGWQTDRPVVVFIGALGDRRKGFDTLFIAWRELCADPRWDADLAVIGAGAELPLWRERAAAAGMSGRIYFLGFRRDVPAILKACDALIAPARYEAYGLGVHEALCCGLPAIVSVNAGVSEQLDAAAPGWQLEDPSDPQAIVRTLRLWRRDQETSCEAALLIASRLRAYTWDHMAADFLRAIELSE